MACELRDLPVPRRCDSVDRAAATASPLTALAAGLLTAPLLFGAAPALAQQSGYGQTFGTTPMERQIYDGGNGRPSGGTILDTTNPLDLMNKIRRGTAMDDATPPASAIDEALQQLEAQSTPAARPAGTAPAQPTTASPSAAPLATTPVWGQPTPPAPGRPASPSPSL